MSGVGRIVTFPGATWRSRRGTDAAHIRHLARMPGVVCRPGGRCGTMPDERVDIPDRLDMIRLCILAMLDICRPHGAFACSSHLPRVRRNCRRPGAGR
ncbi:MAG: hypothetical protein OHK0024_06920 [Thalassobaculales bacterium]